MRRDLERWLETRFAGAEVSELAGDASARRFYRLRPAAGESTILMDYGASFEGETDDQKLTAIFLDAGLPVPEILESAPEPGCLILEDLGDRMLEDELSGVDDQGKTPELLLEAAGLAGRIARDGTEALSRSNRVEGPALDSERFRFEMGFFVENFIEKYLGIKGDQGRLRGELEALAERSAASPQRVLCHRDYHCRNIMVRPDRSLVLVDLQDARWGPDTYDLVSLLFDAYQDVPDAWIEPLILRYLATAGINDDRHLRHRIHMVGTERMIKALGTFGYQVAVAGKSRYLDAIPRTLRRLDRILPLEQETSEIHARLGDLGLWDATP